MVPRLLSYELRSTLRLSSGFRGIIERKRRALLCHGPLDRFVPPRVVSLPTRGADDTTAQPRRLTYYTRGNRFAKFG